MRKICILLSILMLLSLTACQGEGNEPQESKKTDPTESIESEESTESTENIESTENTVSVEDAESNDSTENEQEETDKIRILSLDKSLHTYFEWVDDFDKALVRSENSYVTLGQDEAKEFPEIAKIFEQNATLQESAELDLFYDMVSAAKFELGLNKDDFETYTSLLDVQVRRADNVVISLLADSYSDYGGIENFRAFHGSNYDTQSGKELRLSDVIKNVNDDFAKAVEKELASHMLIGEFYTETTVEDYFANTPYDGFSWTLDYIGITFYFTPGELCEAGAETVTITFAEYPEFFYEKYMLAPEEYTVELALDQSFYTNLDSDNELEWISISGYFDEERERYMQYGAYTDTDGQYYEEDCFAYDLHPYYVKCEKGNYIYLFCEDFDEGVRQMHVIVMSLNNDGSVTKCGEMNVSPSWLSDNKFIAPTNPNSLIFDDVDNSVEGEIYSVGDNGMPSK